MASTVSDFIIDRLHQWGVERIYGYPGDGINGLLGALGRAEDEMRFIQTRHEEMAAFMACAHAKFTDEVGVCLATSGPGAVHLLNGLYDAKLDHQPVVAIVGQQARMAIGSHYQQEIDLQSLFKDVASAYVATVTHPAAVRHAVDRAMRIAKADREVTCVIIPNDVQEMDMEHPPREHGAVYSGAGYSSPRIVPKDEDLQRAADVLNEGERVAMLIGAGALGAAHEVREVADLLGAGVAKALLGKAALDDHLEYCTGAIGLLGTKPSWDMMNNCDTLLMVGTSFPYSEFLPKDGQARGVQIDIKPSMLGIRYANEVNLHGDAKETLAALASRIHRKEGRSWREKIESEVEDWWELMAGRAENKADPINPQQVFTELSDRLPSNVIITADSGSAANWFARDLKLRESMMASLSGGLATMCPGVPYVIAAKFAYPERPAIALVGDGAMQMLGNNGLLTIGKFWEEWSDPRLVVLVLNNEDLNQVTWEQRVMAGDPKFEGSQDLPTFNYAEYAKLCGLEGIRVEKPEQVGPAWDRALSADRPVIVDALTDPNVPPLPPHIKIEQAKAFMASMIKGDANARGMIKQSFKDMVESWLPQTSGAS